MPHSVKIPSASAEYQARFAHDNSALQLRLLQAQYTISEDDDSIIEILSEQPALYSLLMEGAGRLREAFGKNRILQLRVQYSEDDRLLKAAVQLPSDFDDDPEEALRSFDAEWWLGNCHRSGGALVFDYEIRDGV